MTRVKDVIYFAYGSCMNQDSFLKTVPTAVRLGHSTLKGYKLGFNTFSYAHYGGAADVTVNENSAVEGVAWLVPHSSLSLVDAREGAPYVYRREYVTITLAGDALPVAALTYTVVDKEEEVKPTNKYLKLLVDGGRDSSLPESYLETVIVSASELKASPIERLPATRSTRTSYKWDDDSWGAVTPRHTAEDMLERYEDAVADYYETYGHSPDPEALYQELLNETDMHTTQLWDDDDFLETENVYGDVWEVIPAGEHERYKDEGLATVSGETKTENINASEWERMTFEERMAETGQWDWWNSARVPVTVNKQA